jgi:hypothetical protein
LLGSLLDVEPTHRCTAPADETIDEDAEMELTDIAMVVDGNDDGSDESEDEEAEEEVEEAEAVATSSDDEAEMQQPDTTKKHHYRKQNCAWKNAALMYIVSSVLNYVRNLKLTLTYRRRW